MYYQDLKGGTVMNLVQTQTKSSNRITNNDNSEFKRSLKSAKVEAENTLTFGGNIKVYEEAVSLINKLMTENRYPSNSINNSTVNKLDKFEELKDIIYC